MFRQKPSPGVEQFSGSNPACQDPLPTAPLQNPARLTVHPTSENPLSLQGYGSILPRRTLSPSKDIGLSHIGLPFLLARIRVYPTSENPLSQQGYGSIPPRITLSPSKDKGPSHLGEPSFPARISVYPPSDTPSLPARGSVHPTSIPPSSHPSQASHPSNSRSYPHELTQEFPQKDLSPTPIFEILPA